MKQPGKHSVEVVSERTWAARGADVLASAISASVQHRGRCVLALSGGTTPAPVFHELGGRNLAWEKVVITQVDERLVSVDSTERNLSGQRRAFAGVPVSWLPLPADSPSGSDIDEALADLAAVAGIPPVLDVVHLGLGSDGHTASLVPGDPVLGESKQDLALTSEYHGSRRITFTRPALDRARLIVWLVKGADKAEALRALVDNDSSIPAGLLSPRRSIVIADEDAAALL